MTMRYGLTTPIQKNNIQGFILKSLYGDKGHILKKIKIFINFIIIKL